MVVVALGAFPGAALAGEVAMGIEAGTSPDLVRFDTASPGTVTARVPVGGLLAGETVAGFDLRIANGELLALTSQNRVVIVDPRNGATRQGGASIDPTVFGAGGLVGLDFNPTVDRLRLVNTIEENLRLNPITFAPITPADADLTFIATDTHAGANPSVVAEAYTNNDTNGATATTLFGIETGFDLLVRQGAVDGNALDVAGGGSPNGGALTTIGPLNVAVSDAALDIVRGSTSAGNVAYAAMSGVTGGSTLYTIALGSGAATSRGAIPGPALSGLTIMVGGAVRVAAPATAASEAAGVARVAVTRTGDTLAPVVVGYRSADRTAVAGRDYTAVSGTLAFAQDERTKTVTIPLTQDAAVEGTEALALVLGPISGGALLDTHEHTIEVADDDRAQAAPDQVRPALLLAPALPASMRALGRARRLRLEFACSEACTVTLTLKLGRARLGRAVATLGSAGVKRATIRLTKAGRRTLSRARRAATLSLTAVATDPAGNSRTRTVKRRLARR